MPGMTGDGESTLANKLYGKHRWNSEKYNSWRKLNSYELDKQWLRVGNRGIDGYEYTVDSLITDLIYIGVIDVEFVDEQPRLKLTGKTPRCTYTGTSYHRCELC